MFVEYLWGIETIELRRIQPAPEPFVEYLWGIETQPRYRQIV